MTVDHTTSSELELQRLAKLGLDPAKLKDAGRLGMQQNTRCIGDFFIKNGYMDIDLLKYVYLLTYGKEFFFSLIAWSYFY